MDDGYLTVECCLGHGLFTNENLGNPRFVVHSSLKLGESFIDFKQCSDRKLYNERAPVRLGGQATKKS